MTVAQPRMRQVQCKQCLAIKDIAEGEDPHALTWCGCCTAGHHHGASVRPAAECATANHPGQPCWNPPEQPVRPEGCTICRPVLHLAVAGEMQLAN